MIRPAFLFTASLSVMALSLSSVPAASQVQEQTASTAVKNTKEWAQNRSDIAADPNVRFGVMPNGMQYAIMRNATPPGQASLMLAIDAGSLMEDERQLGLAHFMEHMAFNGSKTMPGDEMIQILQRHGLAFGADLNASTSFDQTVYILTVPNTTEPVVKDGLRVLREQVSAAVLRPEDIDDERGVVEGEQRLRNTPQIRSLEARFNFMADGQRLSKRMPIGDLDIIRNAERERFVSFYHSYYRPERATFVAVGDFDVDQMESTIRASFSDWVGKGSPGPEPDLGVVSQRGTEAAIFVDPGARSSIEMSWNSEPDLALQTSEKLSEDLVRDVGLSVFNWRLFKISREDNPPFNAAGGGVSDQYRSLRSASIFADFNPGEWKPALEAIEQEQRRFVQYGVTPEELTWAITKQRTDLEAQVAKASTRQTIPIAGQLIRSANAGDVFQSPQQRLDQFNRATAGLTADTLNARLKSVFTGEGPLIYVTSPTAIPGGESAITSALEASRKKPVDAPERITLLDWPYDDFGEPGSVTDRAEIEDLGVTNIAFDNGVTLTVKPTKLVDDQILIDVATGNGHLGLPTDRVTPQYFARELFMEGGLGKLTQEQLEEFLAGHVAKSGFRPNLDTVNFMALTRPADLTLEMQILAAYLTDPGLRPSALKKAQASYAQRLEQIEASPGGALRLHLQSLLASGDKRQATPDVATVESWTNEEFKASVLKSLARGPVNVTVVGDVSVDDAIAAVAGTFGALPERLPVEPVDPASTQMRFPAGTDTPVQLTHSGQPEQALGLVAWPTTDSVSDNTESRQLYVLSQVMQLRVTSEIRERLSIAYSPGMATNSSDTFPGYGYMLVQAETTPEKLATFFSAVDDIAASLRDAPPTDDELQRAVKPAIEHARRAMETNEYWVDQLREFNARPNEADQVRTYISDFEAATPADIQRLAQKYLVPGKAWRAEVKAGNK